MHIQIQGYITANFLISIRDLSTSMVNNITWRPSIWYEPLFLPTCQSLHPRGFVYTQVVNNNLHDAPQELIQMLRGDRGTKLALLLREILQAPLPPAWEIVTQHGQSDLNHVRHFCVASTRLSQIMNFLHQDLQFWDVGAQLLYLTGKTKNCEGKWQKQNK